jgi:hypothetical protein
VKFIFPQNYNFRSKILGIMDYGTAILNVIFGIIIFGIVNILKINFSIKIFIFIVLFFPVFLMSIVGFYGENVIIVFNYLIRYLIRPKLLFYKK